MFDPRNSPIERFGWPLVAVAALGTMVGFLFGLPVLDETSDESSRAVALGAAGLAILGCAAAMLCMISREARQLRLLREKLDWARTPEGAAGTQPGEQGVTGAKAPAEGR